MVALKRTKLRALPYVSSCTILFCVGGSRSVWEICDGEGTRRSLHASPALRASLSNHRSLDADEWKEPCGRHDQTGPHPNRRRQRLPPALLSRWTGCVGFKVRSTRRFKPCNGLSTPMLFMKGVERPSVRVFPLAIRCRPPLSLSVRNGQLSGLSHPLPQRDEGAHRHDRPHSLLPSLLNAHFPAWVCRE